LSRPGVCPEANAAGFVLAGGQSTRMGADKALIQLDGQALVVRALNTVREAGLTASIAGARSSLTNYAPVIEDCGQGPLSGICAALASSSAQYAVFLPVDLPLLPASLLMFLLRHAQVTGAAVTVPSVNGFAQTFPAVVDRASLGTLQSSLTEGDGGCFTAFRAAAVQLDMPFSVVAVELLAQCGQVNHPDSLPASLWFLNVNTPQDLERAQTLLETRHQVS
jgi:molybdopterin-guanine dinucleotide biosynthesis protein A